MSKGIKKAALALCIFAFILSALPAPNLAAEPASQTVRVKLSTNNATAIAVSVKGEYFIKECGLLLPSGTLTLRSNFSGTISAVHSTYGELYSGDTISLMRTDMQPSAGYLSFNSRRYLGHLYARALSSGYIQLVNEVPVAHYLYGVVAYEMNNLYPLDALKAQAIAAKSYVLSIIAEKPNASYHIGDTSADQVYKGYNSSYTNVIEAVDSTISEVLTVNGRILTAYYSASNGGETTVPGTAWPGKRISDAGFAVALDHYDTANSLSLKETVTIPINSPGQISQQLYDMLIAKLTQYRGVQAQGLNMIRSVELSDPKGRGEQRSMTTMTIVVDGIFAGEVEQNITLRFNVSELLLYRVCTNSKLRSYWGEYSSDGSTYTIYHVRWGHGVGLSQRGAQQRASQGENYRSILAFYYPGATLANYSITIPAAPAKPGEPDPTPTPEQTANPTPTPDSGGTVGMISIGTGVTTARVNIRRGAGTKYESLMLMPKGTKLTVYDYDNGWYYAEIDGKGIAGFVIGDYVKFTAAKNEPTPTPNDSPSATPTAEPSDTPGISGTVDIGTVTGSGVNLRTGPDTSYASIKKLDKNTLIIILGTEGKWTRVVAGDNEGYIHSDYVKKTGTAVIDSNETPSVPKHGEGETTGSVNLRAGEGTNTKKLAVLKKGTKLELIALSNGWYKISCAAGEGYVSAKYVRVITALPENGANTDEGKEAEPEAPSAIGTGVTTGTVNMREKASTSSKILTKLKRGTEVTLYSLSNGWYEAECGGKRGYLYAKYVKKTADAAPSQPETPEAPEPPGVTPEGDGKGSTKVELATGKTNAKVNMRTGASTSGTGVLGTLAAGTKLNILAEMGDWYYVLYDGRTGFCVKAYVNVLSQGTVGIYQGDTAITLISATIKSNVNFRTGPGTTYAIIRRLNKGDAAMVYMINGGWCLARCGDDYGFISKEYVKLR